MSGPMRIVQRFQAADERLAGAQRAFLETVRVEFQGNLEME
jgi:hypothetical protein